MNPDVRHVELGGVLWICVVILAGNVWWRHTSRYFEWLTRRPNAVRALLAFYLAGSIWVAIEVAIKLKPDLGDWGWSLLFAAFLTAITFALERFVSWLNS